MSDLFQHLKDKSVKIAKIKPEEWEDEDQLYYESAVKEKIRVTGIIEGAILFEGLETGNIYYEEYDIYHVFESREMVVQFFTESRLFYHQMLDPWNSIKFERFLDWIVSSYK